MGALMIMSRILCIALVMILTITLTSSVMAIEFNGFRGHKWGDPPSEAFGKDCKPVAPEIYDRVECVEDIKKFGGVSINNITYRFYYNNLAAISIKFDSKSNWAYRELVNLMSLKYGKPNYDDCLKKLYNDRDWYFCSWGDMDYDETKLSISTQFAEVTFRNDNLWKRLEQQYKPLEEQKRRKTINNKLKDFD